MAGKNRSTHPKGTIKKQVTLYLSPKVCNFVYYTAQIKHHSFSTQVLIFLEKAYEAVIGENGKKQIPGGA